MKNILFIGGSGFLGKNLINLLLKTKEYKIHVLCRTESNFKNFHLIDSKVKIYQANLRECDKIKQILTDQKNRYCYAFILFFET